MNRSNSFIFFLFLTNKVVGSEMTTATALPVRVRHAVGLFRSIDVRNDCLSKQSALH